MIKSVVGSFNNIPPRSGNSLSSTYHHPRAPVPGTNCIAWDKTQTRLREETGLAWPWFLPEGLDLEPSLSLKVMRVHEDCCLFPWSLLPQRNFVPQSGQPKSRILFRSQQKKIKNMWTISPPNPTLFYCYSQHINVARQCVCSLELVENSIKYWT